jgi:hypothetical protein
MNAMVVLPQLLKINKCFLMEWYFQFPHVELVVVIHGSQLVITNLTHSYPSFTLFHAFCLFSYAIAPEMLLCVLFYQPNYIFMNVLVDFYDFRHSLICFIMQWPPLL